MEAVPMVQTACLAALVINRTTAIRRVAEGGAGAGRRLAGGRAGRARLVCGAAWLATILTTAPLLVGVLHTWPFPARYSCHLAHELAPYYGVVTAVLTCLVPWTVFLVCSVLIYRAVQVRITWFSCSALPVRERSGGKGRRLEGRD